MRPEAAAYHANLAEAERSLGRHEQAAASCRRALALEPNHPAALNNLGLALHALGRHEKAIAEFNAALSQKPDFAQAQNNRGTSLQALGKIAEAEQAFRAALDLDPTLGQAHANLGQILADQGQLVEGLAHCRDAVRHQPDLAAGHNNLGNVLRALERWAEAEAAFAEAIRLEPNLAIAYANLGLRATAAGQAEAPPCQSRAARPQSSPTIAEVLEQLASAQALAEDWSAAVDHLRKRVSNCSQTTLVPTTTWAGPASPMAARPRPKRPIAGPSAWLPITSMPGSISVPCKKNWGPWRKRKPVITRPSSGIRNLPLPLARRATLLRGRLPQADRDKLRFELYRPHGPELRMNLLFALAHVADASGDHAEAAACLEPANALVRELRQQRGQTYDADEHTRLRRSLDRCLYARGVSPPGRRRRSEHRGRCSSAACRAPARRWSNRSWPVTRRYSVPASCRWAAGPWMTCRRPWTGPRT